MQIRILCYGAYMHEVFFVTKQELVADDVRIADNGGLLEQEGPAQLVRVDTPCQALECLRGINQGAQFLRQCRDPAGRGDRRL